MYVKYGHTTHNSKETKMSKFQLSEAEQMIEAAVDHFISPEAKSDPESRAIMRQWVLDHYRRGAIDLRDYV